MNIYFRRICRMGNQIFIYAFAKALATELNAQLYCDTGWCDDKPHTDDLPRFPNLQLPVVAAPGGAPTVRYTDKYTPEIYDNIVNLLRSKSPPSVVVEGFMQGYRHLFVCEPQLRAELELPILSDCQECIGLHVRRTDFIGERFYLNLSVQWYIDAVERLFSQVKARKIIIFTDDIPWCQANLRGPLSDRFGDCVCDTSPGFLAFQRVRSCAGLAISNSTFSWWAAWLAQVPTICPTTAITNHPEHYYLPIWTKLAWPEAVHALLSKCSNRVENSMKVRKATYGATHFVDVTDLMNRLLREGCTEFPVSSGMGGDPQPGMIKQLEVEMESGRRLAFR